MRILQVLPTLGVGGAERLVCHLSVYIKEHTGHDVRVASLYDRCGSDIESQLEAKGINVYFLGKQPGFDWRIFGKLSKIMCEFQPHVVHSHLYLLRYLLPEALKNSRRRWLHTVHNVTVKETDRIGLMLNHWLYKKRVTPVAISRELGRHLASYYRLDNVVSVANGIPVEDYSQGAAVGAAWRKAHGFTGDQVLLTCVARFSEQKNHLGLLESFAILSRKHPLAHLLLIGDGELRQGIVDRIAGLGVQSRVHLLGVRHDIPEILVASDIFVLASLWEGNPLCLMEAMAAGLPCVATRVGGVPELVQDGVTGRLVNPNDTEDFVAAVAQLVEDTVLRSKMGECARSYARSHFDLKQMAEAYLQLYERGAGSFRELPS